MGQMQRRKRVFRKAYASEGKVPSLMVARKLAWSVHVRRSFIVAEASMDVVKAIRQVSELKASASADLVARKIELAQLVVSAFEGVAAAMHRAAAVRYDDACAKTFDNRITPL